MSFTAAKIIDVAFDIVVGRGGQFILGWVSYRVHSDVCTRLAEQFGLRYNTFAAITLHPNQVRTLGSAVREWRLSKTNLRMTLTLVWIFLAMAYVLAYPTIVSAASSLVGATTTAISLPNNGTAPLEDFFETASYRLNHTGLDGMPSSWIVSVNDVTRIGDLVYDVCSQIMRFKTAGGGWGGTSYNNFIVNGTTYTLSNDTQVACGFYYEGAFVRADTSKQSSIQTFYDNLITCIPDSDRYQWGVSWELLLILLILQITWSTTLLLVWIDATFHSDLVQKGRNMGTWRALLDLAEPLSKALGVDVGLYSQDELDQIVRQHQLPVKYEIKSDEDRNGGLVQNVSLVFNSEASDGGVQRHL
ncbi:hypothetical protein UCRPC4_g00728 [Phaeomoniella chlamydospora]|uniref:Uncharacterized protein n=1 Tax=Phaeomoniella chlamydospora TaxID=158046 RepID=A0A0G2GXU7_PHACM|nr:hypothetical protein UCRPC4_g00728 [Phaeomoniella chlamydospora]